MIKHEQGLSPEVTEAIVGTLREPIIILDGQLRVIVANRAFYDTFKVEYEEVREKEFWELGNGEWDVPAFRTLLGQIISEESPIEAYEISHTFERLGPRIMIINARRIRFDDQRENLFLSISDVTVERKTLREKENLMLQKDTLLLEMRHRIANSLQLIASVILLKAGSVKSEESRAHLEDAHDRIISIATVQRNLDPTSEGSLVPITSYLRTLCESVAKSMISGRKPITVTVTGSDGTATPDEAISMGLITTELVINSLKHAFPSGGEGKIIVTYASDGPGWKLTIDDDGVGLSATDAADREGLGTSIIESLVTQLDAEISRESGEHGTTVSISHPKTATAIQKEAANAAR